MAAARSRAARARERRSIAENSSARFAAARTRPRPCRHSRRACGSEYRDADRPAGADVVAVDARPTGVLQADRFGTQRKGALLAALDEGEAAGTTIEEIGGARGIGQTCLGAGKKDQARLLIAGARGEWMLATGIAQDASQRHRGKHRPQPRQDDGEDADR